MPNVPEYPIVMLAASQAGLKVTTVNPLFNPGKVQFFIFAYLSLINNFRGNIKTVGAI